MVDTFASNTLVLPTKAPPDITVVVVEPVLACNENIL